MADHIDDLYLRLRSTPTELYTQIPPHAHPYPNPNPAFNSMQQPYHNSAPQLNAQMTATGRTYHNPQTPIPGYLPAQARPMYPLVHLDQLTKKEQGRPPQRRNRHLKSPTRRSSAEKERPMKAKPVLPKPSLRSGHSKYLLVPPLAAQQEGNHQWRNVWTSTHYQPAAMAGFANAVAPDFSALVQQQLLAAVEVDMLQQGMTMRLQPPSLPTPHPAATTISAPLSGLTTAYPSRGVCVSGQDNPFTADSGCTAAEGTDDWLLLPIDGGDGPGDMPADMSIPGAGMGGSGGLDTEWLAANVSDFSDLDAALEMPLDAASRVLQQEVVGDVGCTEDEVKKWMEGLNKSGGEEGDVPLQPSDFMAIAAAIEGWEGGGGEEVGTAGGNGGVLVEEKAEGWGGVCAVNRLQLPPVSRNHAELPGVKPVAKMGGEVAAWESQRTWKRGVAQTGEEQPQKKKPKDRALTQDRTNELRSMIPNAEKNIDQLYQCAADRLEHLQLAVNTLTQRKQEEQQYEGDTRNSVADAIGYGMKQGLPVETLRIIPGEGNRFVIEVFLGNNESVSVQNVLLALDDLRLTVVSGGCEDQEGFFWGRYIVEAREQAIWSSIHEKLEEKLNGVPLFHGNYHAAPIRSF